MSKLKFNRLVSFKLKKDEDVTVPKGELWRGHIFGTNVNTKAFVNNQQVQEKDTNITCIEDAFIRCGRDGYDPTIIFQGIAFKVVENV